MVPGCFSRCQNVFYGFSRFQVISFGSRMFFYGFSRFQVGSSWFQMGSFGYSRFQGGFSWFQVGFMVFQGSRLAFYCSRSVFMAPGLVFMIPGGFLSSLIVPDWFKSELSAAGAKLDVENTPKRYLLDLYLGPTIPLGLAGRRPVLA